MGGIMAGPDVSTQEKLEAWLKQQPREAAVAVAVRAAMRALPIHITVAAKSEEVTQPRSSGHRRTLKRTGTAVKGIDPALILLLFRASAIGSVAAVALAKTIQNAVYLASDAAHAAYVAARATDVADVAFTAYAVAAAASIYTYANPAATAAFLAAETVDAAARTAARAADAVAADCGFLSADTPARLFEQALWLNGPPSGFSQMWAAARRDLLALDAGFEMWIEWYEERLDGTPLDVALETKRALIPEEVWKQEPKAVNAYIAQLAASEQLKPPTECGQSFSAPVTPGRRRSLAPCLAKRSSKAARK
jgi:hypothetical protein